MSKDRTTYIQQLCADTGCSLEDLLEVMDVWERWWEKVREIHADGARWWWWWWYIHIYSFCVMVLVLFFCRWSDRIGIDGKQIYLTHRWDPKRSIQPIDRTLTSNSTPDQRGIRSNVYGKVLHLLQNKSLII